MERKNIKKVMCTLTTGIIVTSNLFYNSNIVYCNTNKLFLNDIDEKTRISKTTKKAYITIDDGPSIYTEDIIQILNKYNAKGTFFLIDRNMKKYPDKVKSIVENGNTAGLHSVSHDIHKLYKTKEAAKVEFDNNNDTLYEITGEHSNLIRLPYGSKPYTSQESYNVLTESGYKIWDWNLDTEDWKSNPKEILENTIRYSSNKNEIIILLHEKKQTVEILDSLIKYLIQQGYELVPIKEEEVPKNFWLNNFNK